jgi:hypothetical protein
LMKPRKMPPVVEIYRDTGLDTRKIQLRNKPKSTALSLRRTRKVPRKPLMPIQERRRTVAELNSSTPRKNQGQLTLPLAFPI